MDISDWQSSRHCSHKVATNATHTRRQQTQSSMVSLSSPCKTICLVLTALLLVSFSLHDGRDGRRLADIPIIADTPIAENTSHNLPNHVRACSSYKYQEEELSSPCRRGGVCGDTPPLQIDRFDCGGLGKHVRSDGVFDAFMSYTWSSGSSIGLGVTDGGGLLSLCLMSWWIVMSLGYLMIDLLGPKVDRRLRLISRGLVPTRLR